MLQKVIDYLNKKGWSYSNAKDDEDIFISLSNYNGTYHCIIYVKEDPKIFAFVSYLGTRCPLDKKERMLALINLANDTMLYGNFEINALGEIKHRTSVYADKFELTDEIIDGVMLRNIYNIDAANPIFSKVMFGNITNEEAYYELFPFRKTENKELEHKSASLIENTPND